ncbi:EAL domain-containing protein [Paenibacillus cremeus]|uniref:EAL domain-containing protein n=1 Tax=Paenibacillus cremeus TaxID=2163881 RepID=A0A559K4B4_9BACL|nr:GGDEF domain-containing phosphodiesterase [Paenibacillus cremeus]TVY06947.1 EAL domain-containing protein [Paenibacillus cremeus]
MHIAAFGESLLAEVCIRLMGLLPQDGFIGRINENKFLLSCPANPGSEQHAALLQKIYATLSKPFSIQDVQVYISISIAVSEYIGNNQSVDSLVQQAENALRQTKEQEVHRTESYSDQAGSEPRLRTKLREALWLTLDRDELHVLYQPQFNLQTGAVRGFETLLRWNHPEFGAIASADFIPLAEETVIVPIGQWVMKQACDTYKRLLHSFPGAVLTVNISAVQLVKKDFPYDVRNILASSSIQPQVLELEITEHSLMDSFEQDENQLHRLQSSGVKLALDNFGTGYSR